MEVEPMIYIDLSEEARISLHHINVIVAVLVGYGTYLFGKKMVKKTYLSTTATLSDGYMVVPSK